MKMIKNFVKLLTLCFCVGVATQNHVGAISFESMPNFTNWNEDNGSILYWTNNDAFAPAGSLPLSITFKSGKYPSAFLLTNGSPWSFHKMGKVTRGNDVINFQSYDKNFVLGSFSVARAGFIEDFDGESVFFDNVFFLQNSFVFYTDDFSHTLQVIGDYKIKDYILYLDPLTSSLENNDLDNFFLISFVKKKAWSLKINENLNDFFYGNLSDYNIRDFAFHKSYSLLQSSNVSPFPVFSVYQSSKKSYLPNDIGFTYNKDMDFIAPDFGGGDDNNINDNNNYFNNNIISGYNACSNKAENLRKYLQLMGYCYWQSDDGSLISDILASNGQYNYTGDLLYCKQLSDFNKNIYNQYSDNWNSDGTFNDVNLYDYNAAFNDLVYSWFNNSVIISQSGHVDGLPTQSMCSVYNNVNAYNNEKSRLERASESISDMFGSGVAGKYIDAIKNGSSFSGFIGSITEGTSGFFNTYMFDPYLVEFNSGKNAFLDVVNVNSCSNIHQTIGNYQRGNVALYGFALILLLVLITIL